MIKFALENIVENQTTVEQRKVDLETIFKRDYEIANWDVFQITKDTIFETLQCYLQGNFISTIVLSQIVIDQLLKRLYPTASNWKSFKKDLNNLKESKLISKRQYKYFNKLRIYRNDYVHKNELWDEEKLLIEINIGPSEKEKAYHSLEALEFALYLAYTNFKVKEK